MKFSRILIIFSKVVTKWVSSMQEFKEVKFFQFHFKLFTLHSHAIAVKIQKFYLIWVYYNRF